MTFRFPTEYAIEPGGRVRVVEKAVDPWVVALTALAEAMEPKVRAAFLRAVEQLRDDAQIGRIKAALATGNSDAILRALGLRDDTLTPIFEPLRDGFLKAGAEAYRLAGMTRIRVSFDYLNPHTIQVLRTYKMGLIRQITEDTREGIRAVVRDGVNAGRGPIDIARDVRGLIGLTDKQAQAVLNYRAELQGLDRAALVRRLRDGRFDRTVARAIRQQEGLDANIIDKLVARYRERFIKHRSEVIARTESIRAANAGAQASLQAAVNDGHIDAAKLRREWVVARDERTCPTCAPIPGMNKAGVGISEAFQTPLGPVAGPPIHPQCRCVVTFRLRTR